MPLWYTDRSRYEVGIGRCPMLRYLQYHAGPTGYGFRRVAASLPLMTGTGLHDTLAPLLDHVRATDTLPSEELIRAAITAQTAEYAAQVTRRSVADVGEIDPVYLTRLVEEQTSLITGLVWSFVLDLLPLIHTEQRVLSVEVEEALVLDCTCGLGDATGSFADHEAKNCNGIGVQGRADFITENRQSGMLCYHEFKTTGRLGPQFETQWETKLQFALGMLGSEARLGRPIHEHLVIGLYKGRRSKAKDPVTNEYSGPKYQDSVFCYGWYKEAEPPVAPEEWKFTYDWVDEAGRFRRLGKKYQRRPAWEYPAPANFPGPAAEYWVRAMPREIRTKSLVVLGPYNRQDAMIDALPSELIGEESRWLQTITTLAEVAAEIGVGYWTDTGFQDALNGLVPRSWECRRYGADYACEMEPVCFRHAGWEDPFRDHRYELRRPHHEQELLQMRARGLEPPVDLAVEESD